MYRKIHSTNYCTVLFFFIANGHLKKKQKDEEVGLCMISRKHLLFNVLLLVVPWLSILFLGKYHIKRFSVSAIFIVIFEIINHIYGHKRKWWKFYDKPRFFLRDELPFSIGPYMPISLWILKYSFGNFKKFVLFNVIADGVFAFLIMNFLKRLKIVRLKRLSNIQFFIYLHYKCYLLYGIQYLYEKFKRLRYTMPTS